MKAMPKQPGYTVIYIAFILTTLVWLCYFVILGINYEFNWESLGLFGDSFGGLNTLFAGWAFAGIIVSLYYQQQALQKQFEELVLTREQLAMAAQAQNEQSESFTQLTKLITRYLQIRIDNVTINKLDEIGRSQDHALFASRFDIYKPFEGKITAENAQSVIDDVDTCKLIKKVLNDYEALAFGASKDSYDSDLIAETRGDIMKRTFDYLKPFIDTWRSLPHTSDLAWEGYEQLITRWRNEGKHFALDSLDVVSEDKDQLDSSQIS